MHVGNTVLASGVTEKQRTPVEVGMEGTPGSCVTSSCSYMSLGVTAGSEYTQQKGFLRLQSLVFCEKPVLTRESMFFFVSTSAEAATETDTRTVGGPGHHAT